MHLLLSPPVVPTEPPNQVHRRRHFEGSVTCMFEVRGYKIAVRSHHVMNRATSAAPGVMAAARARTTAPQPLGIGGAAGHSAPTIHSTKEGTRIEGSGDQSQGAHHPPQTRALHQVAAALMCPAFVQARSIKHCSSPNSRKSTFGDKKSRART